MRIHGWLNTIVSRRLSSHDRSQVGRVLVPGPTARSRSTLDDAPVCASRLRMGTRHRPRPTEICDALDEAHEGDPDLSSHRKPPRCSTPSRAHADRKHRPVPRCRSRRRPGNRRKNRCLKYLGRAAAHCPPPFKAKVCHFLP